MDTFLKKCKLTNDSNISANYKHLNIQINIKQSASINDKSLHLKVKRKYIYIDGYICFGFTWNGDIDCLLPVCISSVELLFNRWCKHIL
jgi:hypothetical protein